MITRTSGHDGLLDPVAHIWSPDRPIVVAARNSGQDGRNSRRQAINDLLDACDRLTAAGCDISAALPSEESLDELLRNAVPVRSKDKEGRVFLNRMVTIDLRPTHGVYVVLSVGTGRKLDEQGTQPFVQYLAQTVISIEPCLVFAKRLDRMSRRAWAHARTPRARERATTHHARGLRAQRRDRCTVDRRRHRMVRSDDRAV